MTHKSLEELEHMLQEAHQRVDVGARYVHYKKQQYYIVKELVIWEASDEVAVIYQADYAPYITFARALGVWLEVIEWEGKTVPRFAKVADK